MTTNIEPALSTLYETDYVRWVEANLERLRAGDYAHVDWANLLEEIEEMSRSERNRLESNLIVVLLHLLKWQHQPQMRSGSWQGSILEHRRRIRKSLKNSPSLKPFLQECFIEAYGDAVEQAALPIEAFPDVCPYSIEQVLDSSFLPE